MLFSLPAAVHATPPAQDATPPTAISCDDVVSGAMPMGTPGMMAGGMPMASPGAGMSQDHMAMDLDQMYIDMMVPHHASIIALAEAAMPRLTDPRLRDIAQAIVSTQQPEIEELRGHRQRFFGDSMPMPMDRGMMEAMQQMMPGMMDAMGNMDDMAFQMDARAQVAAFCAAENPDLAFIDLVIPHHQMAIVSSEIVRDRTQRADVRAFAERVIAAQQRETDELTAIRDEITGAATPTGS